MSAFSAKKKISLIVSAIFAGSIGLIIFSMLHSSPKTAEITSQEFDFGEGRSGSTVTHIFHINNPGDVNIPIVNQASSCSCTIITERVRQLNAHTITDVGVQSRLGMESERWGADILLERGDALPPIKLGIVGRVIEDIPQRIDLGQIRTDKVMEKTFPVKPVNGKGAVVRSVRFDDRFFDVKYGPAKDNVVNTLVSISTKIGITPGPVRGSILLVTDDLQSPERSVEVTGMVLNQINVNPAIVTLDNKSVDGQRMVEISARDGRSFRITRIRAEPENYIEARLDSEKDIDGHILSEVLVAHISISFSSIDSHLSEWSSGKVFVETELGGKPCETAIDVLVHRTGNK